MKHRLEEIFTRRHVATVVASAALLAGAGLHAQDVQPAKVHGHVQNAAGQTLTAGQVKFSKDEGKKFEEESFTNTTDVDKDGNYTVSGVVPGDYFVWFVQDGKPIDRQQVTFKAGEDRTLDFDMTRAEYINSLSPEQRKQIEEFKAKNGAAMAGNKQVANLNATITSVRADLKTATPNFEKDLADMKQATEARPNEGILWVVQGDVYAAQGKKLAAADRANKTNPMQDDAVKSAYSSATDAYKKATDLMAANPKPNPEQQANVYNQLGNAYGDSGKASDASTAFDKAASLDPKGAAMYYTNEAIILDRNGGGDAEAAAADKAIQADPSKPLPYYLKGQSLLSKATVDNKTGQIVPPPGCLDAYQKYLQLAPDGPQAAAVKDILTQMGQKVETKYKAPGRK